MHTDLESEREERQSVVRVWVRARAHRGRREKVRGLVVAFFAVDFSMAVRKGEEKKLDCSNIYFFREWINNHSVALPLQEKKQRPPPCFLVRGKETTSSCFLAEKRKCTLFTLPLSVATHPQ